MATRKIRGKYRIDFRFEGRRYRKSSPGSTKADAVAYEALLRRRLLQGKELIPREQQVPGFENYAMEWLASYVRANNKPSVQRSKRTILDNHLLPHFGKLRLDDVTPRKVERYKAQKLEEGLSAKTVNNQLAVLRRMLVCAHDDELLEKVPKVRLLRTEQTEIRYLSSRECELLLQDQAAPLWNRMVFVGLHTGMRFGELCGLHWEDIDFERGLITIRHSLVRGILGSTKSRRIRYVPMAPALQDHLAGYAQPCGRVFSRTDGREFNHPHAADQLSKMAKRVGIGHVHWHMLRHTFATQLVGAGVTIRAVQVLLGHSDIRVTERYAHVGETHLKNAVGALEACFGRVPTVQRVHGQHLGNRNENTHQPRTANVGVPHLEFR